MKAIFLAICLFFQGPLVEDRMDIGILASGGDNWYLLADSNKWYLMEIPKRGVEIECIKLVGCKVKVMSRGGDHSVGRVKKLLVISVVPEKDN